MKDTQFLALNWVTPQMLQYLTVTQSEAFSDANWVWEVVQININDIQK